MAALELVNTVLFTDPNITYYCRFEGNSNDSIGSNNGTDTGITYSAGNGKFGQGAGFDGSTSKIVLPDSSAIKQTGQFTLFFWFKTTQAAYGIPFQAISVNTNLAGYWAQVYNTGEIEILSGKNTGTTPNVDYARIASAGAHNDGNWHMYVATYDGSNLNLYIDNLSVRQVSWTNAPAYAATTYSRIGCQNQTGTDTPNFAGAIDDLAIFSRALTSTEVAAHWAGTDAPITSDDINVNDSATIAENITAQEITTDLVSVFDSVTATENLSEMAALNVNLARSGVRII